MDIAELNAFVNEWLATWTGNRPQELLNYYTDNALYIDPAMPQGICGKEALNTYFTKLLQKNPSWVWTSVEIMPTQNGFTLKWRAEIPVKGNTIVLLGLDIVELEDKKISRNEVYFDRHEWISALLRKD
jgi:hypothetical protein